MGKENLSGIEFRENIEELKQVVVGSLDKAFVVHESLGESGEELINKNQFGDTALRADIEAEQAVLNFLREAKFPVRVISEEYGITEIGTPRYLGILDGIDGSNVYKKERGRGRYGTMFGIFSSTNPAYEDYLVSGIMEHSTKRLFVAYKGGGAFVRQHNEMKSIKSSGKTTLDTDTQICIDEYWEINRRVFKKALPGFKTRYNGASCINYADLVSGEADLALECTRKGNLELAAAYGLISEAGAVMVDMGGESLGNKKYLEFGQKEHLPIITAATQELASQLLKRLQK